MDIPFDPQGVIPACLMPFNAQLAIDEQAYRTHLRDLANVAGISAITVNGHASEVEALHFEEQQRSIELAYDELGDRLPLIVGVTADDTHSACRIAQMAAQAGARGLLVFPTTEFVTHGEQQLDRVKQYWNSIASTTDLPLILFQYPLAAGLGYPLDTLLQLCNDIPAIKAIKDWCDSPALHERQIRELHALNRPVKVLTTHSMWLLSSLVMGCDGLLSGAGSIIANLHVALWQAVQQHDLTRAMEINERIYPTVQAFYSHPLADMHNRMKTALELLGHWENSYVRPPLNKLSQAERDRIKPLLTKAELNSETLYHPLSGI